MKVEMKWGRWLICTVILVAAGFYWHWDKLSVALLGILLFTGAIRLWIVLSAPGFERRVASMPPEQRERFLANLPEAERERWRERLRPFGVGLGSEPAGAPNRGPATQPDNSKVIDGPSSMS